MGKDDGTSQRMECQLQDVPRIAVGAIHCSHESGMISNRFPFKTEKKSHHLFLHIQFAFVPNGSNESVGALTIGYGTFTLETGTLCHNELASFPTFCRLPAALIFLG